MEVDLMNLIDNGKNKNSAITFLANSYLNKNSPICREERQYALFLYNSIVNEDAHEKFKFKRIYNRCIL